MKGFFTENGRLAIIVLFCLRGDMNKRFCVDIEYGRERDFFVEKLEFETKNEAEKWLKARGYRFLEKFLHFETWGTDYLFPQITLWT